MRMLVSYYLAAYLPSLGQALAKHDTTYTGYPPEYCTGNSAASLNSLNPPSKWAFVLFRAFEPLDVLGPYEALFTYSRTHRIDIAWLAETLKPVSTGPQLAAMNPMNSGSFISIPPTHTFATVPSDIEILLVPGGPGARAPNLNATLEPIPQICSAVSALN